MIYFSFILTLNNWGNISIWKVWGYLLNHILLSIKSEY